ncbi:BTB And Kelch, partial [Oesophagostomum dentatum]
MLSALVILTFMSINVLSQLFQLNDLTEKCAEYLRHRLNPQNVLFIRAVCSALNCSSTEKDTERFVEKYFTLVCDTDAFLELPIGDLIELLSRDNLYVENEETVCKAALRWVDHDPENRKAFMARILKCVRLLALNSSFLAKVVGRHPLVRGDQKSRDLLNRKGHGTFRGEVLHINLIELLSRDNLYVENEETVCKAALRWVDHDPENRKAFMARILKCVRLLALNSSFLAKVVGRHPLVRGDQKSRDLVDEVKDYHLVPPEERTLLHPSRSDQRSCNNLPCLFFVV